MKKQQLGEWRAKTIGEIEKEAERLSTLLTGSYLARSARKLQNVAQIKTLRRDIAQLRTLAREKDSVVTGDED